MFDRKRHCVDNHRYFDRGRSQNGKIESQIVRRTIFLMGHAMILVLFMVCV